MKGYCKSSENKKMIFSDLLCCHKRNLCSIPYGSKSYRTLEDTFLQSSFWLPIFKVPVHLFNGACCTHQVHHKCKKLSAVKIFSKLWNFIVYSRVHFGLLLVFNTNVNFCSMGGHGALICFLKNPGMYKVSKIFHRK